MSNFHNTFTLTEKHGVAIGSVVILEPAGVVGWGQNRYWSSTGVAFCSVLT